MDFQPTTWMEFFDRHAPYYLQNTFTQNTRVEVQFMLELFDLPAGARVLDIGCGAGRHCIELALRGFRPTGIDFSAGMLAEAKRGAAKAEVEIEFIQADATEYIAQEPFDAGICICEGGFGLVGQDEDPVTHDLAILRNISASLKPGAPFLLTALNGYAIIRRMSDAEVEVGAFDPTTMIATYLDEMDLPEGKVPLFIRERLFIPPEATALLHHSGFEVQNVWGGTAGDWGKRPIKLDEIEAMYFARKR